MNLGPVVVLGTSGHARSCMDVMAAAGFTVRGCVGAPPTSAIQAPFLGDDDVLDSLLAAGVTRAFVAVGSNRRRRELCEHLAAQGFELPSVVSPAAVIAPNAVVGAGSIVMHGCVVGPYTAVGQGAIVNTGVSVDHDCSVGDYAHLAPGTHTAGDVVIGEGAFLGVGVSVVPECSIGSWTTVGAGAAVTGDLPSDVTAVGVPARPIKGRT